MLVPYGLPNGSKLCFHVLYFCKKVAFCCLLWMVFGGGGGRRGGGGGGGFTPPPPPPVGASLVEDTRGTSGTGFVLVASPLSEPRFC